MALEPDKAAALYRSGQSACQIAAAHGLQKSGAEQKIRKGGISGGLAWCPVHHVIEELG